MLAPGDLLKLLMQHPDLIQNAQVGRLLGDLLINPELKIPKALPCPECGASDGFKTTKKDNIEMDECKECGFPTMRQLPPTTTAHQRVGGYWGAYPPGITVNGPIRDVLVLARNKAQFTLWLSGLDAKLLRHRFTRFVDRSSVAGRQFDIIYRLPTWQSGINPAFLPHILSCLSLRGQVIDI